MYVQGVKDISFSNDGRKFLSSSYDKVVKLWDTETGKVLRSFGEGKMFFTARWACSCFLPKVQRMCLTTTESYCSALLVNDIVSCLMSRYLRHSLPA